MGNLTFIILLSITGILLLLAELLIIPGVGVAGFLGIASMGGACYVAFTHIGSVCGAVVTVINALILVGVTIYALRAKTWQKLALKTNIDATVGDKSLEIHLGDHGTAETRLGPMGTARFNGTAVEVKSMQGMISPGTEVEVTLIEDKKVYVKAAEKESQSS